MNTLIRKKSKMEAHERNRTLLGNDGVYEMPFCIQDCKQYHYTFEKIK